MSLEASQYQSQPQSSNSGQDQDHNQHRVQGTDFSVELYTRLASHALPQNLVLQILPQYGQSQWTIFPDGPINANTRWRIVQPGTIREMYLANWYPNGWPFSLMLPQPGGFRFWEENPPTRADLQAQVDRTAYGRTRRATRNGVSIFDQTYNNLLQTSRTMQNAVEFALRDRHIHIHLVGPGSFDLATLPRNIREIAMNASLVSIRPTYFRNIDYSPTLQLMEHLSYIHVEDMRIDLQVPPEWYSTHAMACGIFVGDTIAFGQVLSLVQPLMQVPFLRRTRTIDNPYDVTRRLQPQGEVVMLRHFVIANQGDVPNNELSVLVGRVLSSDVEGRGRQRPPFIIRAVPRPSNPNDLNQWYMGTEEAVSLYEQYTPFRNGDDGTWRVYEIPAKITQDGYPLMSKRNDWNHWKTRALPSMQILSSARDVRRVGYMVRSLAEVQ